MSARDGQSYISGLKAHPRDVWIAGRKVADVTADPAFRRPIAAMARLYDCQFDPALHSTMTYLPDDLMVKVDVASMAHGLETRSPLLDHVLLEWAARIPAEIRMAGGRTKALFKAAMAPYLPIEILRRKKMGFGCPIDQWLRHELKDLAYDTLLAPAARERGEHHFPQIALGLAPGDDDPLEQRDPRVAEDELLAHPPARSQATARGTGAEGRVEGEVARLELGQRDAALGAAVALREGVGLGGRDLLAGGGDADGVVPDGFHHAVGERRIPDLPADRRRVAGGVPRRSARTRRAAVRLRIWYCGRPRRCPLPRSWVCASPSGNWPQAKRGFRCEIFPDRTFEFFHYRDHCIDLSLRAAEFNMYVLMYLLRSRAAALPMPRIPPVTIAVLPASSSSTASRISVFFLCKNSRS